MAIIDVVRDYDWTSIPRGSKLRNRSPYARVKSYKLISNNIMQSINSFVDIAKNSSGSGNADSFYDKLYADATKEQDSFNFPFFSDSVRSFSNGFGDTFQNGLGGSGGIASQVFEDLTGLVAGVSQVMNLTDTDTLKSIGGIATSDKSISQKISESASKLMVGGNPGTYIETPMFYQFEKSDSPIQVNFILANTINSDSIEKNKDLVKKLTKMNRPLRKNSIAVDPPCIYEVKVPGLRYIRWAYCDSFNIELQGTRRLINNEIIPEAYSISMSFKSLTLEHAGFVDKV